MANNYVVTASRASAVTDSLTGNFTGPKDLNLIMVKNTYIIIYLVEKEGLRLLKEVPIYGRVSVILLFRPTGCEKDHMFVLTNRYSAMILECRKDGHHLDIITKACGELRATVGRPAESGIIGIIDPECRVIGLRLYDGAFKIIQLGRDMRDLPSFDIRLEELNIIDIQFLHGYKQPTIIIIYQDQRGRHVKTLEINLRVKEFYPGPWNQDNVENEAFMIMAVPEPVGGALIIGQESITYHKGSTYIAVAPPLLKQSMVTCCGKVDADGFRYLLGDMQGRLFMLILQRQTTADNSIKVGNVKVELLGETNIAQSITYLDNSFVFVGSQLSDSQVIKLSEMPDETGSYIEVLQVFQNLGPIVDMVVVDLDRQGQGQLVTCSGAYKGGSLRVIRNGIGIKEDAVIELPDIKGLWCVKAHSHEWDDMMIISFIGVTKTFLVSSEQIEEQDIEGCTGDEPTYFCANVLEDDLIQVTPSAIRLVGHNKAGLLTKWSPPEGEGICVVAANQSQVVVSTGRKVYYFQLEKDTIKEVRCVSLDHEVACLDVTPMGERKSANLCAVALWRSFEVLLLSVPEMEIMHTEPLEIDMLPRSIYIGTFERLHYLLVAIGDGSLIYFNITDNKDNPLKDKKTVILGTQPTYMKPFKSEKMTSVFTCSDRPTVIYSSNQKLVFSNVNLKDVDYMCPLNSSHFPNSLAIATKNSLTIGKIDGIQKLHIHTIPLYETPRRIAYQQETQTFGVITFRVDDNGSDGHTSKGSECASLRALSYSDSMNSTGQRAHTGPSGGGGGGLDVGPGMSSGGGGGGSVGGIAGVGGGTVSEVVGGEVEQYHLLILHQHTFEVLHAHKLRPNEYGTSLLSITLGDPPVSYYVIGTALVIPEEPEPKMGRIIVFRFTTEGRLRIVSEKEIRGVAYCMAEFNGKLLVSINSTIRLFNWTDEGELAFECQNNNNIIALYLKTRGDFVLVGDLMRSVSLLSYRRLQGAFDEIGRDFNPNWMTAIEFIDDDTFLGAENFHNLFTCHKESGSPTDEARLHLQEIGKFHLGDFVNVFKHGSLVMQSHLSASSTSTQSSILFGTISGAVGMVTQLSDELFCTLKNLQNAMGQKIRAVGDIQHAKWRSFNSERRCEPSSGFVDGDLVESFLDLNLAEQDDVIQSMEPMKDKNGTAQEHTVDHYVKIIEELTRIH